MKQYEINPRMIISTIVIAVILVSGAVYWYINQPTPTNESLVSCTKSLYLDNRNQYDFWEAKFSKLYPNLKVYDAGAYCKLSNGDQLVSFSHFSQDKTKAGQTIILFDKNNNLLKATDGFYCQTMGDLGYPVFDSIKDNKVIMSCSSGDAGYSLKQTYELNLDTFKFNLIK